MTIFNDINWFCANGFYGSHTTSQCLFSSSHYPYFPMAWTGGIEVSFSVS
jgi:hypothetical protein